MSVPSPDPGMAVKMAPPGIANLDAALSGRPIDEDAVRGLVDFVHARHDCSDFRMVTLLTLWLRAPALSAGLREQIKDAILGFPYWMDEPGTDAMCIWSENHQVIFSAAEYIAGQSFPDERFGDSGFTGRDRQARAAGRLDRWLADRFRFGYTEWASTTYYEEDAAGLGLLVEHCADAQLAARAAVALDLLFLDMALYCFQGRLVTTSGRAYEEQKKYPERTDVDQLLAWAFPAARTQLGAPGFDLSRISGPLLSGTQYRVPAAIAAIAAEVPERPRRLRASTGLDLGEVSKHYDHPASAAMQWWAMEAFTNPESINSTTRLIEAWGMQRNAFLTPLAPFVKLRRTGLLPGIVRLLNPATQGVAIQRANITCWRSAGAQLASVQGHHPGEFGDQQHLWTLALPGDVAIFGTHPGAAFFDSNQRGFSPAQWVGNAINPAIGQDHNVLLACYDTRGRRGLLENWPRARLSHLFVPFERLDDWEFGTDRLFVRAGDGSALILADGPIERDGDRLVRRGRITGWAVIADAEPDADYQLTRRGGRLKLRGPGGRVWKLDRRRFLSDGDEVPTEHPRFDTPWVRSARLPERLEVAAGGHLLVLGADGHREISADQA